MSDTLTLPVSVATQRKLRALAMLMGGTVGSLEAELSEILDSIITERCAELLGIETTTQQEISIPSYTIQFPEGVREAAPEPKPRSFAEAAAIASEPSAAHEQHEVSGDEDLGENKSLQEQFEEEKNPEEEKLFAETFSKVQVRDAKDNHEAFLDSTMAQDESEPLDSRARKATGSFESRKKAGQFKARVAPYQGE